MASSDAPVVVATAAAAAPATDAAVVAAAAPATDAAAVATAADVVVVVAAATAPAATGVDGAPRTDGVGAGAAPAAPAPPPLPAAATAGSVSAAAAAAVAATAAALARGGGGLDAAGVAAARERAGWNEIAEVHPSALLKLLSRFWGPIPWMLEAAAVLTGALQKWSDVGMILGLLLVNGVISFAHDHSAAAAVAALKGHLQVRAKVLRDGAWCAVPARELVPGDVVRLRAGDMVPADAAIVAGVLTLDQAALTGESAHVTRDAAAPAVLSGAVATRGEATVVVTATGTATSFGKTASLVATSAPRLHSQAAVARVASAVVALTVVLAGAMLIVVAATGGAIVDTLPLLIMILVSGVPSALPAVFTLTMALGSRALTARGVLITSLAATEDAAGMTFMCVDKTGTLTQNRLAVVDAAAVPVAAAAAAVPPTAAAQASSVTAMAALASSAANLDAIDVAVLTAAGAAPAAGADWTQDTFTPFDASLRRTEAVVTARDGSRRMRVVKGAPNTVAALCSAGGDTAAAAAAAAWLATAVAANAARGCRSLAVAASEPAAAATVAATAAAPLRLVGVLALRDPPRADSAAVLRALRGLGIHVILLTGDAVDIARAVARDVGLAGAVVSLTTLAAGTHGNVTALGERLVAQVATVDGLAEVLPEHKHSVVRALQARGALVGMTGDGVNDAPALAQAEVGVAVSGATDVAKGAARAILMTDGLGGIVDLVTVSRTVHARIATWVVNKVAKEMLQAAFIAVAYFATGAFIVQAFHLVLLLVLVDFITLSITSDHVAAAPAPLTWHITPLFVTGAAVGVCGLAESLGLLYIALHHLGYTASSSALNTFAFQTILYFCCLNVYVVREQTGWAVAALRPSATLLAFTAADIVVALTLCTVGAPAMTAIPLWHSAIVLAWAAVWGFVVNDAVKVAVITYLLPRMPACHPSIGCCARLP